MKNGIVLLLVFTLAAVSRAHAQEPVQWTYTAKALSADTYEVRLVANIDEGWHLYAEKQPEDAIAVPTSIQFTQNPLMELSGAIKEEGKLDKFMDPSLGVSANQYLHKVDFVQIVKLKAKVQAKITGTIKFQVCNEQECLPPAVTHFSIPLNG